MFMLNYVLVFVFLSITTGFRIDFQNEGKSKSPFYQAINRIRRSEDSKELVESEDTGDDMEVAENRFIHQGLHSFLPFPPTQHGYLPGPFPHLGHHQQVFGNSDWQNGNGFGQEGYGHHHQVGYEHGHHKQMVTPFNWQNVNAYGQEGYGYNHHHNHQPGYGHGYGHGHGHVHGFGCGHDLNNEFNPHEHNHHKNDKSTPPSVINPSEVTTPSTSTTSEIYDIDVRLGS